MRSWIVLFVWMLATLPAAANLAVVGPELLTRTTGSPQTFERQLPPLNPNVEYRLIIKNGVVPADRVTSASVVLDGVEIFGPDAFNKTVAILSRTVRLKSTGSLLRILIAGGPGSFLEVSILAPFEAYTLVPATGGTAAVTNPDSPIAGTTVTIPQEAVPPGGLAVTIGFTETPPAPVPGSTTLASKVFEFKASGAANFASPVRVTVPVQVPFAAGEVPVVLYWSLSEQKFKAISPQGFDRAQGLVTFETSHFSTYAIGKFDPSSVTQKIDTGFRVGVNSLRRLVAGGSAQQLGGALYAIWYYLNKPASQFGALFNQYVQETVANPEDLFIIEELTGRLAAPLAPVWQGLQTAPAISTRQAVDDLITALAVTNEPQLFVVSTERAPSERFVGVVYSYDPQLGQFEMYELSTFSEPLIITGNPDTGNLVAQTRLPVFPFTVTTVGILNPRHIGLASLIAGPELEGYFAGAAAGWATPPYSRIQTPPDYLSVRPGIVTPLSGSVQQSTHVVSQLEVFYSGQKVNTVPLDAVNQYSLNYVSPGSTTVVWLVGSQPGSPVWNDKAAFARFRVRTETCPTPWITSISPSPLLVSPTSATGGTFVVRGANLAGSQILTNGPLLLTGNTMVNGEGTVASRGYEIGPVTSNTSFSMFVSNACGGASRLVRTALQCAGPATITSITPTQVPVAPIPGGTVTGTLVVEGQNLWGVNVSVSGRLGLVGETTVNATGTEARRDFVNGSGIPDGEPITVRVTGPCGQAAGTIVHSNTCRTPVVTSVTPNPLIGPTEPGLFNSGTFTLLGENLENVFLTTDGPLALTSQTTTTPTSASVNYLIGCCVPQNGQVFNLFANSSCGAPGATVPVTISLQP